MILPFSLEAGLLLLSNNIYRLAEHFSLSLLFCSDQCCKKYDFEDDVREYYCNASSDGWSSAPQEGSDRDSQQSALLVVPVSGFLAEFLPMSLAMTVPSEAFLFHTSGSSRVQ